MSSQIVQDWRKFQLPWHRSDPSSDEFGNSVVHYREWDQARWRVFFWQCDAYAGCLPSKVLELSQTQEFQDALMKVGVFGSVRLFDQTPCVWDFEIGLQTGLWETRQEKGALRVTSLATKILRMPDDVCEEDRVEWNGVRPKGHTKFDDGIVFEAHDSDPIVFRRREQGVHVWCARIPWRADGGFFSLGGIAPFGLGETFARTSDLFAREHGIRASIDGSLAPLLPAPLRSLIYDYATYLGKDNRAQEKRDLRNLFYKTFEKAAYYRLPEEGRGGYFWHLAGVLGNFPEDRLKMTSGLIAQYVDDNEEI